MSGTLKGGLLDPAVYDDEAAAQADREERAGIEALDEAARGRGSERHGGPGPHKSGSPQSVHGAWSEGPGSGTPKAAQSKSLEAAAEAGGFTYRRIDGAPSDGFMVSPYKRAERKYTVATFNHEDVARYRDRFRDLLREPEHYLGGWRDGDIVYLDISVRRRSKAEAARLAREHGQLAIYDLASGDVIPTEEIAA